MLKNEFQKKDGFYLFTISLSAILLISLLAAALSQPLNMLNEEGNFKEPWFWIISAVEQLSLFACVFVYAKINKIDYLKATKTESKINFKTLIFAVILGVGVFCLMNPVQLWILQALSQLGYTVKSSVPVSDGLLNTVLLIVVVVILPAFCEEQLFRGAITNGLSKKGLLNASLISGALFMIYHVNPAQTIHQFVMGVVLAYIALKSVSIVPAMLVHLINNLIVVVVAKTVGEESANAFILEYWYILLSVGLIIAGLGLYGFIQNTKHTKIEKQADDQPAESPKALVLDTSRKTKKNTSEIMILAAGIAVCVLLWLFNLAAGLAE